MGAAGPWHGSALPGSASTDQHRRPRGHSPAGRRAGDRHRDRSAQRRRRRPCPRARGLLPGLEPGLRACHRALGRRSVRPPVRRRARSAPRFQAGPRTGREPDARVVSGRRHRRSRVRRTRGAHPVLRRAGGSDEPVVVDRPGLGRRRPVVRVRAAVGDRKEVSDGAGAAACRWCRGRRRAAWRPGSGPFRRARRGS